MSSSGSAPARCNCAATALPARGAPHRCRPSSGGTRLAGRAGDRLARAPRRRKGARDLRTACVTSRIRRVAARGVGGRAASATARSCWSRTGSDRARGCRAVRPPDDRHAPNRPPARRESGAWPARSGRASGVRVPLRAPAARLSPLSRRCTPSYRRHPACPAGDRVILPVPIPASTSMGLPADAVTRQPPGVAPCSAPR